MGPTRTGGRSRFKELKSWVLAAACAPILTMTGAPAECQAQQYRDPAAPVEQRIQDLLSRMTLEEKSWQLFMLAGEFQGDPGRFTRGLCGLQTAALPDSLDLVERANLIQRHFIEETRLGIPVIFFAEALHGLVQEGATVFPQAIGLAATFDVPLMEEVGQAIATECRARGVRQVLSPVINIADDVRWGRTEETYGEDPFLTSEMGVAFVAAHEQLGIAATPKHFIANVGAGGRDSYPIQISPRLLREVHLPPFVACLSRGGARSVMTAYNSFDGSPCSASEGLLNGLLKGELGFAGLVVSDAGAVGGANVLHFTAADYADAGGQALNAGLDVIFQTSLDHHALFWPAFRDGNIGPEVLDKAVARVLRLKFELGLFENPYADPTRWPAPHGPETVRLARRAARESLVLLKNEGGVLPFGPGLRSLAVIGPEADTLRFGGYSADSDWGVTLLEGITRWAGETLTVRHARGCARSAAPLVAVPASALAHPEEDGAAPGLRGEYFANALLAGEPRFTRTDAAVSFDWTLFSPDPLQLGPDDYSVRWTGTIAAPVSGPVRLGVEGNDGYRLFLDDTLLLDSRKPVSAGVKTATVDLTAGRPRPLRLECHEPRGNARIRLVWDVGVGSEDAALREAVATAGSCDAVVLAVGIEEGEFRDRASLALPGRQEELIRRVAALGKPVAVVLTGGSAITMESWLDEVPAVLAAWYPGEQGGAALADVLFGEVNPAGRLPFSCPGSEGQLPLTHHHLPTGRGDDYLDRSGMPRFPFGHGLSYTVFTYTDLALAPGRPAAGEPALASFTLTNSGPRAGGEVVQLYIRDRLASLARPVLELKGFRRVHLEPGESRRVEFVITPQMLTMLDRNLQPVLEPGEFRIMIGSSSQDIRLQDSLLVEVR